MATRCLIGCKDPNTNNIDYIYCHWDGYPQGEGGVGDTLKRFYTSKDKVKKLISLGDLSSLRPRLAPEPGEEHTFENFLSDVCIFYHRDRKEPYEETVHRTNIGFELEPPLGPEYLYLFEDGKWKYCYKKHDWKEL